MMIQQMVHSGHSYHPLLLQTSSYRHPELSLHVDGQLNRVCYICYMFIESRAPYICMEGSQVSTLVQVAVSRKRSCR